MTSPPISFWPARALNCLQNSIMWICACPSAGPTGGAGVALPAAICNFTCPVTFFAMIPYLSAFIQLADAYSVSDEPMNRSPDYPIALRDFLHLPKLQLHRRRPSKDR